MSQENVEIVRQAYEALNEPDFARSEAIALDVYDVDVVLDTTTGAFDGAVYHGHDGLREESSLRRDMWTTQRFEPKEFIPVGEDHVIVPVLIVSVGRGEIETVANAAILWTIRDGRVARVKTFQSKADALESIELRD